MKKRWCKREVAIHLPCRHRQTPFSGKFGTMDGIEAMLLGLDEADPFWQHAHLEDTHGLGQALAMQASVSRTGPSEPPSREFCVAVNGQHSSNQHLLFAALSDEVRAVRRGLWCRNALFAFVVEPLRPPLQGMAKNGAEALAADEGVRSYGSVITQPGLVSAAIALGATAVVDPPSKGDCAVIAVQHFIRARCLNLGIDCPPVRGGTWACS